MTSGHLQPVVVIPAHNEAAVIGRCLRALRTQPGHPAIRVVVAANGCTDETVAEARRVAPEALVLDLPSAGKSAALNAADASLHGSPRVYVDADVEMDSASLAKIIASLDQMGPRLALPARHIDLDSVTGTVRRFYEVQDALMSDRGDFIGAGVYAVNQTGRERWGAFPALVADDFHVHSLFDQEEKVLVAGAVSIVRPPRRTKDLLAVRARVLAANRRYRAEQVQAPVERSRSEELKRLLSLVASRRISATSALTWLALAVVASRRARSVADAPGDQVWVRDNSSR